MKVAREDTLDFSLQTFQNYLFDLLLDGERLPPNAITSK